MWSLVEAKRPVSLSLVGNFGASAEGDRLSFPVEGFDMGSLSMRSALFG